MVNVKLTAKATIILALLSLFMFGCEESGDVAKKHVIEMKLDLGVKTVFIDNFINLSGNSDMNYFETATAEQIENAVRDMSGVDVVYRSDVIAVAAKNATGKELWDIARSQGANYIVEGWIEATGKKSYRIYANLLNLESSKVSERFAVAEFSDKDSASTAINSFVVDIASRLNKSPKELDKIQHLDIASYDAHRIKNHTLSAFNSGRSDIAISILNRAKKEYQNKLGNAETDHEKDLYNQILINTNFYLGQIYIDLGKRELAVAVLDSVYQNRELFSYIPQLLVEAIWEDLNGDPEVAIALYEDLIQQVPKEKYIYFRLSDILLRTGKGAKEALAVLEKGMKEVPHASLLYERFTKMKSIAMGEWELSKELAPLKELKKAPVKKMYAVSEMLYAKLIRNLVKDMHAEPDDNSDPSELYTLLGMKIDLNKVKATFDISTERKQNNVLIVAQLSVVHGDYRLSDLLSSLSLETTDNKWSKEMYLTIEAGKLLIQGDLDEGRKLIKQMSRKFVGKYFSLTNLYFYEGKEKEAILSVEKVLDILEEPYPMIFYSLSKIHLMAGNHKESYEYTKMFIESCIDIGLITREMLPIEIE